MAGPPAPRAVVTVPATGSATDCDWPDYEGVLARARSRSGADESVTVAVEPIAGLETVVARLDFDFLGGSMGRTHGDRIVAGIDEAIRRRVPFVAVIRSGGARTQEGFLALVQMLRTADAVRRARAAGIPVLSVYRNPTTGGVHASYGAAADVIVAERGATVGFAGPRVVAALTGVEPADGSHSAERYAADGLVDGLSEFGEGLSEIAPWVALVHPAVRSGGLQRAAATVAPHSVDATPTSGWDAVARARDPRRPRARQIADALLDGLVELRGDRTGHDDPVVLAGFGRIDAQTVAVIGLDRSAVSSTGSGLTGAPSAVGFRKARRLVDLAGNWGVPIITLIDTAGADASSASDRAGLTAAISGLTTALLGAPVPSLAMVIGEGGSGGAIALAGCDALLMQDDAVFEVIAPEGAAAILLRDPSRAPEVADWIGLGAAELLAHGYVDELVPGPTSVGSEASIERLGDAVRRRLGALGALDRAELLRRRESRYRRQGTRT